MTIKKVSKNVPRKTSRVVSTSFDYSLDFEKIDFRKRPELYRIGRGEQGVLSVEPYKSEILPHWRFADEEKAQAARTAQQAKEHMQNPMGYSDSAFMKQQQRGRGVTRMARSRR